ncbi:hypothetical protein B0H17DRAFT_1214450 [Mycena rosella]|uniref:Uncharacterized protein n=1 Tax=Mycena rosella TaxID=1033263 RepID=A0AAD7CQF8_MYCRO|nr:hypothetical protein B0H17DRAFT_1214450 [Mycena rosella]
MPPSYDHTVDNNKATFLGFGLEAIFYGINLILFAISTVLLYRRRPGAQTSSRVPMFAVTVIMFSLCTVHFALNFNNVYDSLLVHPRPEISAETPLLAGADMLFSITDWCSQLILIYRCYLVWGRNIWIIIFPISCPLRPVRSRLIGLVLSINPTAPVAPAALVPVGTAGFALSLCLNFIVSALIVGRIWQISRQNRMQGISLTDSTIQRAIGIIVESGLLFLAAQFVFVVLFAIKHPAQAILEPVATQIYGISPTLIVVRVGLGASFDPTSVPGSSLRFVGPFPRKSGQLSRTTHDTHDARDTLNTDMELSRTQRESSHISLPKMGEEDI